MLTSDQLRMARAALRLSVNDLAARAGIGKGTIARIEVGYGAYMLTLRRLREVLEEAGVAFIDANGAAGAGVRLKLGVEPTPPKRTTSGSAETAEDGDDVVKVLDQDMADYWRERPELWAQLSEGGRQALSDEMFGDPFAADEAFSANG
jgi:transcriptional regulator with XRE-family HTH domain